MALNRVVLPRRLKLLIVSALLFSLGFAGVAQYYNVDPVIDAVVAFAKLPESSGDDNNEKFGCEPVGPGLTVSVTLSCESRPSAFFDSYYPESSYRIAFIGAPPRAPPLPHS